MNFRLLNPTLLEYLDIRSCNVLRSLNTVRVKSRLTKIFCCFLSQFLSGLTCTGECRVMSILSHSQISNRVINRDSLTIITLIRYKLSRFVPIPYNFCCLSIKEPLSRWQSCHDLRMECHEIDTNSRELVIQGCYLPYQGNRKLVIVVTNQELELFPINRKCFILHSILMLPKPIEYT